MSKLTTRQIVQLHSLHQRGVSNKEIARALSLNRNSITAHISGEIAYTAAVYRQIKIKAPLARGPWLTLRQAAPWIPGHPSPSKLQHLVAGRSWRGRPIPKLKTQMVGRRRLTTLAAVRRFVSALYPPGIWVTETTLMSVAPWEVIRELRFGLIGWDAGAGRVFGLSMQACPLLLAAGQADSMGIDLHFPAELVHRGTTIERHVGTAVI